MALGSSSQISTSISSQSSMSGSSPSLLSSSGTSSISTSSTSTTTSTTAPISSNPPTPLPSSGTSPSPTPSTTPPPVSSSTPLPTTSPSTSVLLSSSTSPTTFSPSQSPTLPLPPSSSSEYSIISSTFSSTFYLTTTNSQGQTITSAPSQVTFTSTSTNSDGMPVTVTQVVTNPTLSSPGGRTNSTSAFFQNKGAVAGVFVVVGLAATSIVIFVIFWFRRRRRNKRIEHDSDIEATLAAHGYGRTLVDGDDDENISPSYMSLTHSQGLSTGRGSNPDFSRRLSSPMTGIAFPSTISTYHDSEGHGEATPNDSSFDPYHEFGVVHPSTQPAQPSVRSRNYSLPFSSDRPPQMTSPGPFSGHVPTDSGDSSEPLLVSHSAEDAMPNTTPMAPPPPSSGTSGFLDKMMTTVTRGASRRAKPVRSETDEFEYDPFPKPLLEVRNNPE